MTSNVSNNLGGNLSVHFGSVDKPLDLSIGVIGRLIDPLEAKGPTHTSGSIEKHWVIAELSKVE